MFYITGHLNFQIVNNQNKNDFITQIINYITFLNYCLALYYGCLLSNCIFYILPKLTNYIDIYFLSDCERFSLLCGLLELLFPSLSHQFRPNSKQVVGAYTQTNIPFEVGVTLIGTPI